MYFLTTKNSMLRYLKLLSRGFIVLLSMSFHLEGVGEIFYIHPQGNDQSGNGSSTKPWRSLHYATGVVKKVGDIIHVMKGVYVESASCLLAEGVNIEGEGEGSIIMCSEKADWTPIISATSPEGADGNQHISGLTLDGQKLSSFWAIRVAGRSNVSIYNCTIVDFKDRGVIFDGRNDNKPEPPIIFAKGNSFHDNIVKNCAAYNTENGIYGRGCLNIGGQDSMLIYNNNISQVSRPDGFNGWPIKYSNDGYLKNVKIFNNILTKIPYAGKFGGDEGWDFAVELWNVLGGVEIFGNTVQGSIDIVFTSNTSADYGIWIHHNSIAQPKLNRNFESGIVFEMSTESVIVENNKLDKISGGILFNAQENSIISDVVIRKNDFSNIGRSTGDGNNGNAINMNCGTLKGNSLFYIINNVLIDSNRFSAAIDNAPFYGIEISGAPDASNIRVSNNIIEKFLVACIFINPGNLVDSLSITGNEFIANGNFNNPLYVSGIPSRYRFENNKKSELPGVKRPVVNVKQQIVRPLYYEVKRLRLLEILAFLSCVLALLFAGMENIYAFGISLVAFSIYSFWGVDSGYLANSILGILMLGLSLYGWYSWYKRTTSRDRKLRISFSTGRERLISLGIFLVLYVCLFFLMTYVQNKFPPDNFPGTDAFIVATVIMGFWAFIRKKMECWYWWMSAIVTAIVLYQFKHYLLVSMYCIAFLCASAWGFFIWRKKSPVAAKAKVVGLMS